MSDSSPPAKRAKAAMEAEVDDKCKHRPGSPLAHNDVPVGDPQEAPTTSASNLDHCCKPAHRVLSVLDLVLIIMSSVKESLGWEKVFLNQYYDEYEDSSKRDKDLAVAKSFLNLGSVNHYWRAVFLRYFHSSWSVIPATLANEPSSLAGCIRLSGESRLTLTLRRMPDERLREIIKDVVTRLSSLRLRYFYARRYEPMERSRITELIASVKDLEVDIARSDLMEFDWLSSSPPQLETLRLTNFVFAKHCECPATLREFVLDYACDPRDVRMHNASEMPALLAVLARMPLLESLRLDLRHTKILELCKEDQASMPVLKRLCVCMDSSASFIAFVDHISCPSLERAHLIAYVGHAVGRDLRLATSKFAQLVQKGSHPSSKQPDHFDFGHVYIDERGEVFSFDALWQTTVAVAPRADYAPLADDKLFISNTAVLVVTVKHSSSGHAANARHFIRSNVVESILSGLPDLDLAGLTIHSLPCWVSYAREGGPFSFDNTEFMKYVGSARKLHWFANHEHLAHILETPDMFPQLQYLAVGLRRGKELPETLNAATLARQNRAHAAIVVDKGNKRLARRQKKEAWQTVLLPPATTQNVRWMFNELLSTLSPYMMYKQ
ncbi:hypothetical protein PENSPDRAFT_755204 [Peniophora sp. CONT]|nr:hypothetical protein PENSPDRAFT_755204 [Peniophora sp. CONT]